MNIDHFINVLFEASSIKMSDYDESVDFTAQYEYEHRSFHQFAILGFVY